MILLYVAVTVAHIWIGVNTVRLGWRVMRISRHHHRPFAVAAFGAFFLVGGIANCTLSPYLIHQYGEA